jgi:hypothetical protein
VRRLFHALSGGSVNLSTKRCVVVLASAWVLSTGLSLRLGMATAGARVDDRPANQLSEDEKKAGWKLLFDGKSLEGWHNFKKPDVQPGWTVKDGTLACVDPHNAGDIVTTEKFGWFELSIEYNISEAGNSGIMFHISDKGNHMWESGPEIQLEDNKKAADPIRCGWMYQLYKPEIDPNTNKPIDATKPVGEWNQVRVVIAAPPAKSEVDVNGVKYYDFVYNSDDFKARIAKSKFRRMPLFARSDTGFIGLQGDHGAVAFRNIKIRSLDAGGASEQTGK